MSRVRPAEWLVGILVVAVLAGGAVTAARDQPGTLTLHARLSSSAGLYVGNHVDIVGVPVGTVTAITPHGSYVDVTMQLPDGTQVPRGVQAVLISPTVVSDRVVELTPAYTAGPVLASGAVIPLARTAVPVEIDDIFRSVDELAKALGPEGANGDGSLSTLVSRAASALGGNGATLHDTITALGDLLPALAAHRDQAAGLLTNLDQLTSAVAAHDQALGRFTRDLGQASAMLADERSNIASALTALQTAFAGLAQFLDANRANLGSNVHNLVAVAQTLLAHQQELIEVLDAGPLSLENLSRSIFTGADGRPRIGSRYDALAGSDAIVQKYCGPVQPRLLRLGLNSVNHQATPLDVVCVSLTALDQEPAPPGAPAQPDLGLSALVGAVQ